MCPSPGQPPDAGRPTHVREALFDDLDADEAVGMPLSLTLGIGGVAENTGPLV